MRRKRTPSLDDLSAVIASIHDAGGGEVAWPVALEQIGTLLHSATVGLWTRSARGEANPIASVRPDPKATLDYAQHYHKLDTLLPEVLQAPAGTVLSNSAIVRKAEFVRTEFYADFARRYDMDDCMQARIFDSPTIDGYIGIARSRRAGAFGREEARLLRLLLPHLRRAMQMQLRLSSLGVERDSALEALDHLGHGVLIVDAQARVTYANSAAERLLRKADGLGVEPGSQRLRAAAYGQTGALRRLIAQAANKGNDALSGAGGSGTLRLDRAAGTPLLLSVAPLRAGATWNASSQPAALILIGAADQKRTSAPAHLRALYSLTTAEASVAERIAEGQGVRSAAEALSVAPSTLRWHLQRVFEKTGTARQAELARLVERLSAM